MSRSRSQSKELKSQLKLNRFLHNIGHFNYANLNSQNLKAIIEHNKKIAEEKRQQAEAKNQQERLKFLSNKEKESRMRDPPSNRGGKKKKKIPKNSLENRTKDQLVETAKKRGIKGTSKMSKNEIISQLRK